MRGSDALDHLALLERLAAVVREAGDLARRACAKPIRSWYKGADHSPVSEIDIAVDHLLRERLVGEVPGCAWLSEETEDDPARLRHARVWVVDPIDGTRGFLAGLPDWTVSVALVEEGRPSVAALFAPATDEMFLAVAGRGATRNGRPISASGGRKLAGLRAAGPVRKLDRLATSLPDLVREPKVHSLALRFARVAEGRIDVAVAGPDSHDWDLAAADLLVHEAAGTLTTFAGEILRYNRPDPTHPALVASGTERHGAVSDIVADRRRGER